MRLNRHHILTHPQRRFLAVVALPVALLALGLTATVFYALHRCEAGRPGFGGAAGP